MGLSDNNPNSIAWKKWRRHVRKTLVLHLPLRGTAKVVLRELCNCLGEDEAAATSQKDPARWCYPGVRTLALAAGKSDRWIQEAIKQLTRMGLIERAERFAKGTGQQEHNHYRILWSAVAAMINASDERYWRMKLWKFPARPLAEHAKTSPSPRSHFTGGVKSRRQNFTGGVKSLHPLTGNQPEKPETKPTTTGLCLIRTERPAGRGRSLERGTLFGDWLKADTLSKAIQRRDADTLKRAFNELGDAVMFSAPVSNEDRLRLFSAMAYDAVKEAKTSPVGLLAVRLTRSELTLESCSQSAWKWAGSVLGQGKTKPEECFLCAQRGFVEPTCSVCGTPAFPQLPR